MKPEQMQPEHWRQIEQLYHAALERDANERAAFLTEACAGDEMLRGEVESLLRCDARADNFIEAPALEIAAQLRAEEQSQSMIGRQISHYQILSLLGAGGMGEVYLAQDTMLRRKAALKLLPAHFTADENRVRRFIQEAQAASALNHPNIITIYEIGQVEGRRLIATEFIDGQTLRQQMTGARLKLRDTLEVAIQIASALAAAHAAGIVHRDIKPENVMVRPDGLVKVLDFGLAKLTEAQATELDKEAPTVVKVSTDPGTVMGTISYMSPEQARGLEVDGRTDIFSLGVALYEMLTGRAPFEGTTIADVIAAILDREPPPLSRYSPEAPAELQRIVTKALRKDRDERYQGIKDLLVDLKSLKQEMEMAEAGSARTTSSAEYIVAQIKRHRLGVGLTLAALVVAAAVAFFYFNRAPALTDKDTVLLADFVNTTGDAVFDGTLKQALAVQLEQSPFLNIFPDERVRETLRFMGRSPDERVTRDVAREICQRQGLKAMLLGSIASLGRNYVITLEAINSQTGDAIARQQVEAESKEQVLRTLGRAASQLRERLGESLGSIQKFDTPIEQATTSSLEALKAISLGDEQRNRGKELEAIPFYKRAIDLDPAFALAYAKLSLAYFNSGQRSLATETRGKAFALRERVSERERFFISANYYSDTSRETDKAVEVLELWKQTYPRDYFPHVSLSFRYCESGQCDKAVEEASEAIRLNPNYANSYSSLGIALITLNRFAEAKDVIEQALARKIDKAYYHYGLYSIAFVQGDTAAMRRQIDLATGKPYEYLALGWQAETSAFAGQLRQTREFSRRAADLAQRRNSKVAAAVLIATDAIREAMFGNCRQAHADATSALALSHDGAVLIRGGGALALCGEIGQAQSLADELAKQNDKLILTDPVWLPALRAVIENQRGKPDQAIRLLQTVGAYEEAALFWPAYLRGASYLRKGAGAEAAAEFQKILDHRGHDPTSFLYPLAHLGLARAAALTGDTAKSRQAYQDFFALWKDADADLPILIEAKKEYGKLK